MNATLEKPEAMIFDMDGTLFKTETLLLPAYHKVFHQLRKEGIYEGPTPPEERILGALGMLLNEIWHKVLPASTEAVMRRADELLLHYQLEGLQEQGGAELYPGVRETLQQLYDSGIKLYVASNGLEHYVKGVAQAMGIAPYFHGLYSAGEHNTSTKVELVRILLEQHQETNAWMVGDRSSDVEAGIGNNLTVIGCDYARFGAPQELDGSTRIIRSFPELLGLIS